MNIVKVEHHLLCIKKYWKFENYLSKEQSIRIDKLVAENMTGIELVYNFGVKIAKVNFSKEFKIKLIVWLSCIIT